MFKLGRRPSKEKLGVIRRVVSSRNRVTLGLGGDVTCVLPSFGPEPALQVLQAAVTALIPGWEPPLP